ncbi:MAG TPA: 50S ribosomal protein L17, partial [Candidatus Peribacter riflensis]|nr:50S ribosomal protein L17 [Candidatus Peribacter riflensis]
MRHRLSRHRLALKPAHARMFKRNLLTSLLLYESVRTTKKRAQVV